MLKRRLRIAAVLLAVAAFAAGCLTTGTAVITAKLSPDAQGNPIRVSNYLFATNGEFEVDLNDNATFKDYKDDIRNIDNIGFYLKATNNDPVDMTFQLFLEPDTSANYDSAQQLVDSYTDLILTDITIPANQTVIIDWNQSMEYVTNLDNFKDAIEGGVFSLYAAAIPRDVFDVTIDSLVVIVTLTGSK